MRRTLRRYPMTILFVAVVAVVIAAALIAVNYERGQCEGRGGTYVTLYKSALCQMPDGRIENP